MKSHADLPIALVGIMGAGKSSVARVLGQRLGAHAADLDRMIEEQEGCTISELFELRGESAFRRLEGEMLERAIASGARILACGGGVVLNPAHRATLRSRCSTVWLEVTPAEAARRAEADGAVRPLLGSGPARERLGAMLESRSPLYAEVARHRVSTDSRTPEEVADAVLATLAAAAR